MLQARPVLRGSAFVIALAMTVAMTVATAVAASRSAQPPPGQGTHRERAACHPDVMRYCRKLVKDDQSTDIFAVLDCLQAHRLRISVACRTVLAGHGQ